MGMDSLSGVWRELQREVQTTVGRRRSKTAAVPTRITPPAGAKGLVIQESGDDGWDVIDRVEPPSKPVRTVVQCPPLCTMRSRPSHAL